MGLEDIGVINCDNLNILVINFILIYQYFIICEHFQSLIKKYIYNIASILYFFKTIFKYYYSLVSIMYRHFNN